MNAEKRSAFTVAMGAVLLVATLAAVSPLGLAQHGARIAVFHLEAADTAASGGGADVYIQRNAGWDVNIDIYNRSGETINDVEIVLESDVDFGDSFYPNTPRISTTADGNTQLHWATGEIPDGARVHVGFDHSGGHVTIVGIYLTKDEDRVAEIPPIAWEEGPDTTLVLRNPWPEPIVVSNFRDTAIATPIQLQYLSAVGLQEMEVFLSPLALEPYTLGPGETFDTRIRLGSLPAPATSLWGLAFLALVPPVGYILLRLRRSKAS